MRVWIVSFVILFILAQFILWLKDYVVPFPFYVFGGACLALASNSSVVKLNSINQFWSQQSSQLLDYPENKE